MAKNAARIDEKLSRKLTSQSAGEWLPEIDSHRPVNRLCLTQCGKLPPNGLGESDLEIHPTSWKCEIHLGTTEVS